LAISKRFFGKTSDGQEVFLFTLSNKNGLTAKIINLGGAIIELHTPDRNGNLADITLGYDNVRDYEINNPHFGGLIGRYGNRIGKARFELNGKVYQLAQNDGNNHLHGGHKGFDKVVWTPEIINDGGQEALQLSYLSKDGEENYPGNLQVKVIYSLNDDNELKIDYHAVCDQDTIINLTNHAYFNLAGHNSGDILKHQLMLNADKFTPIDNEYITTGEIRDVKGTPFDFTKPMEIGARIFEDDEQLRNGNGYDHNFVLNVSGKGLEKAAEVYEPVSGRLMEVFTNKPGIQFYSGNFLDGSEIGKGGFAYQQRAGFCLETQFFPNSPNYKHFPSPVLKAGEKYNYTTVYKFSAK